MTKTTEGRGPTPEDSLENVSGDDRLVRVVQAILAIYLLPALALVLLVGFAMLFVGAMARVVLWLAGPIISIRGFAGRTEPLVSGAWIYRVGGGSRARQAKHHVQAASRSGWLRQPDSDVLN